MPPDHQIYSKIIAHDIEKSLVKANWHEIQEELASEQMKKKIESDEALEAEDSENILDLAKIRSTSWKNVKRVVIKEFADEDEGSRRVMVKNELLNVAKSYIADKCDISGRILESNVSEKDEKKNY